MLENWPHARMLGNGPHPCNQFMIGVFLFLEARPFLYLGHIGLGNRPHMYRMLGNELNLWIVSRRLGYVIPLS